MKRLALLALSACALYPLPAKAQMVTSFVTHPKPKLKVDPPPSDHVNIRYSLGGGEWIPEGFVWAVRNVPGEGDAFVATRIGSCELTCGRPMSWRQAAFDKKALALWGSSIGLGIADIESLRTRPCFKTHTCVESNPLMGSSRARQYGVMLSLKGAGWLATTMLRKGNRRLNIGGMKHWWIFPVVSSATNALGLTLNAAR